MNLLKAARTQNRSATVVLLSLLLVLLGACSNWQSVGIPIQDGAGVPVDISSIPDAVPIDEEITSASNNPYQQFGKTYVVLPSNKGYRETGTASWYGSKFHGRKTSNGDTYDMYAMTAAHKTLPIPSYVRVTNLDNKRWVIVRVNDRGPFHDSRIIDMSYVAALKLGFAKQGTADVSVAAVLPNDPITAADTKAANGDYLQVGAFDNRQSATMLATRVGNSTGLPAVIRKKDHSYKVLLGPIADDRELLLIKQTLKQKANISAFTVEL